MATVTAKLEGGEALLAKLQKLADARGSVRAGVLEGAANADGKSVLEYAPVQEFGGRIPVTDRMRGFLAANYGIRLKKTTTAIVIPPRSFLRTAYQEHRGEWFDILARALKAGREPAAALEYAGIRMQDDIVAQIASSMPPANSPATDLIKQQDAPANVGRTLMHTGTLAHSIAYEVTA